MFLSVLHTAVVAVVLAVPPGPTKSDEARADATTKGVDPPAVAQPVGPETKSTEKAPKANEASPGRTRVLFITSTDSPNCVTELTRLQLPGGEFDHMRALGWKIGKGADNHLQFVDRAEVPEIVGQFEIREFPIVACLHGDEIVRSFRAGCTTPLDAWTFGWLAKGVNERPEAEPSEAAKVESTGHYQLRGNHWSIDGDVSPSYQKLLYHLRGPVHGPQIKPDQEIETWSYEELRSLHDNLHEIEMGGVQFGFRPKPPAFNAVRSASSKAGS